MQRNFRGNDLTGNIYDRLTVLSVEGRDNFGRNKWLCLCNCGGKVSVTAGNLRSGNTRSCGCLNAEKSKENIKKSSASRKGEESPFYKQSLIDRGRSSHESRQWRTAVFTRDGFTCDLCKVKGLKLNAHHLDDWSNHIAKRYDVDNGISLCKLHHDIFHLVALGGHRHGSTREQYVRFKSGIEAMDAHYTAQGVFE